MPISTPDITKSLSTDEFFQLLELLLKSLDKNDVLDLVLALLEFKVTSHHILRPALFSWTQDIPKNQVEALMWIAKVRTNERVAEKMDVSERTVRRWVDDLASKLRVTSKEDLILIAKESCIGKKADMFDRF